MHVSPRHDVHVLAVGRMSAAAGRISLTHYVARPRRHQLSLDSIIDHVAGSLFESDQQYTRATEIRDCM